MTTSILTPVDFSDESIAAASRAAAIATCFGYTLGLLSVVRPTHPEDASAEAPKPENTKTDEEVRTALRSLADSLDTASAVDVIVKTGDPGDCVVDAVRELEPFLVVMATHGRGRVGRLLFGSVADRVRQDTDSPVLTEIHPSDPPKPVEPFRRVMCALEFAERDAVILTWASSFAQRFEAELTVIHAASGPEQWQVGTHLPPEEAQMFTAPEWRERMLGEITSRLETLLHDTGTTGRALAELGSVEHTVPQMLASHHADLLVIGRTQRTGLRRTLSDHTAALIRTSPCPVITV